MGLFGGYNNGGDRWIWIIVIIILILCCCDGDLFGGSNDCCRDHNHDNCHNHDRCNDDRDQCC